MAIQGIARLCAGLTIGLAMNMTGAAAFAQTASELSIWQAGYNAGSRLASEDFTLLNLDGVPFYSDFLRGGEIQTISVEVPSPGRYVLLIGGDNDTVNLDLYAPQINANDTSFGRTGFIEFDVFRPGRFFYQVDMQRCNAGNCGMVAYLLKVSK
jgi:hypothetical protein